jgi:hypothetical protein
MNSIIKRFIAITILIIMIVIEFIYLSPIYLLSLMINFIITLIWYFPSIYQFYSFIFTAKEYNLRIRIYLLILSPIIIILYIPMNVIYLIGYGIFLSLINPLMTIIQRPDYPLYTLSLTAAIAHLIYKYVIDYYNDEFLTDVLILEKIKFIYFVKKWWNFNSVKFLEKIEQTKSYGNELIFFKLVNILDIIAFFFIMIIPYIIRIIILILYVIILVLFASFFNTIIPLCFFLDKYKYNLHHIKLFYLFLISLNVMFIPIIFPLTFIMFLPFYIVYFCFKMTTKLVYKSIELYKKNDGFYNVIDFFWVITIYSFLDTDLDRNYFIYVICRINVKYNESMVCEASKILNTLELSSDSFDPIDPFDLVDFFDR